MPSAGARLRALLAERKGLVTPGCYDALSAKIAEHAGFEALAISGFGVEAALLGQPDVGLLTMSELIDQARRITAAVSVPVTCDAETGFGGVHNIARLVREMEAIGIAGIQLEDQANPKRCPALEGRTLVSMEEQIVRLRAALAARADPDFLIIARSDADVIGYDELVRRSNAYLAAGAEMAMPICFTINGQSAMALSPNDQMALYARLARDIDGPVKAVLIPEGYTAADMASIGYNLIGLTGGTIEASVNAMHAQLVSLRETGSEAAYRAETQPAIRAPGGIMDLLGLPDLLDFERRFSDGA